ncbi:EH signature domain-containing protein [Rhodoferax sediminis]|uniref:EH signature domain-containing protein n=1 Tax=Rhodoferax sediminis TaxID=2509614 RepID=UPI00143D7BC0|nr:EH signature domain-containing protein [Rhodoferax sediminis]
MRARLLAAAEPKQTFHAQVWGNPRVMTEALRDLKRELGAGDAGPPSEDLLQSSLRRFGSTQQVSSFTELKYVCYGVTVPVGEGQWRVIDRKPLFNKLIGLVVQREAQPKQFRRCYQGLLGGYFGYDRHADTPGSGGANWKSLRSFLDDKLAPMKRAAARRSSIPDWLTTLVAHRNLLTDDPCSRYATGLVKGRSTELKEMCAGLGIASSSWVWDDALMAYVRMVCKDEDRQFQKGFPGVLDLVNGRSDLKLAQALSTRATALTVARYARCADKSEHQDLRDSSLHWIGNPWLKRTAWDAEVKYEPARQMVEGWLKRRLIKDFFELLAQDGGADLRRLNYWLKWEPQITDMWFVLGTDAQRNRSEPFIELRKRMTGRGRVLVDNNSQNNAFVMRIGPLLVIEFGVTGNACYVFAASDFRTNLEAESFSIHALKQRAHATRLPHMSQWESRFDYELKRMLQSVPASKGVLQPAESNPATRHLVSGVLLKETLARQAGGSFTQSHLDLVQQMCSQHGIDLEDHRPRGGALWVVIPDRKKRLAFSALLDRYGFRYTEGKGFWIKTQD